MGGWGGRVVAEALLGSGELRGEGHWNPGIHAMKESVSWDLTLLT